MRELIDKLLHMGYTVVFSPEQGGEPRISIFYQGQEVLSTIKPQLSCKMTAGTFLEASEAALQDFISTLQKRV